MELRNKLNIAIVIIFCTLIVLPVTGMFIKIDPYAHLNENRVLTPLPAFKSDIAEIAKFSDAFQAYFNDHFGLRNTLIRLNFLYKYRLLGVSPSSQVIVGKKGWFFYNRDGVVDDYRGLSPFDENKLQKLCFSFELKKKWLALHGIKYLLAIPPNKEFIYSEYLPDGIKRRVRNRTGLDDFAEYLLKNSAVDIVDLRPALLQAKKNKPTYLQTDTHWNSYGAFIGYRTITDPISGWFPEVHALSLNDFDIVEQTRLGGDLANMAGGTEFIKEADFKFKPLHSSVTSSIKGDSSEIIALQENDSLPRALVFGDSFIWALFPFLSENFQHVKYLTQIKWYPETPIQDLINSEKPDIVIEETVERSLKGLTDFISTQTEVTKKMYGDLFKAAHNRVKIIDIKTKKEDFQFNEQTTVDIKSGGLLVKSSGNDPMILLPAMRTLVTGYPIMKINIDSSSDTFLQLFLLTTDTNAYGQESSVTVNIKKGENEIFIPINTYKLDMNKKIRLDPAACPGEFLLKSIEVAFI